MERLCSNCIYKNEPTSIRDFYLKTLEMPNLKHWGDQAFRHHYWLCGNPNIAKTDCLNNSVIFKPCISHNLNGGCDFFKTENAIDILPSIVEIEEPTETIYMGDEVFLEVTDTPFTTPAVTEEKQKVDIDGISMVDEEGNPIMEEIIIEPEFINEQEISFKYQWYKNGRKLFSKKAKKLKLDTSIDSVDEYYCAVTQNIYNNGDGGLKTVTVETNKVEITVEYKDLTPPSEETEDTEETA